MIPEVDNFSLSFQLSLTELSIKVTTLNHYSF